MTDIEKILEMISEGKISAGDGERLLNAIHGKAPSAVAKSIDKNTPIKGNSSNSEEAIEGDIIVEIKSEDSELVKLKLPIKFAGFMFGLIPKDQILEFEMNGINLQDIIGNIPKRSGDEDLEILNISTDDGTSIKIYVKYQ